MKHILIFGASSVHGVGDENGGWADKFKAGLHKIMYASGGTGPVAHVYQLGVPGSSVTDIAKRLEKEVTDRIRGASPEEVYLVFCLGTNDARAVDDKDSFVMSPDKFSNELTDLLNVAKQYSHYVLGVGVTPVDEAKTLPFQHPDSGRMFFFANARLGEFEEVAAKVFKAAASEFIPLFKQVPDDWQEVALYVDGLHPNDDGNNWIRNQVEPTIAKMMTGHE